MKCTCTYEKLIKFGWPETGIKHSKKCQIIARQKSKKVYNKNIINLGTKSSVK